jgi:hypothetical protein
MEAPLNETVRPVGLLSSAPGPVLVPRTRQWRATTPTDRSQRVYDPRHAVLAKVELSPVSFRQKFQRPLHSANFELKSTI